MSVKAMGLVWDLECPRQYGELVFKPSHKYVLIAYADHADHLGRNIFPAVKTVSKKTGLDERSVQRLTRDLEDIGLLVSDGLGPRGTNKWHLPYNQGGDKLSPLTNRQGGISAESLGDMDSGDMDSGDKLPPEFKEPELNLNNLSEIPEERFWKSALEQLKGQMPRSTFDTYLKDTRAYRYHGNTLEVAVTSSYARDWLESRVASMASRLMVGIANASVDVVFVVPEEVPA